MYQYATGYIECGEGVYKLVGTVPQYMTAMLFENEAMAELAKQEAIAVLQNGMGGIGIFAQLYWDGADRHITQDIYNANL